MSFRDRFRKFKSDTKSRIFQANKNDNTDVKPGQPSANFAPGASRNWIHLRTFLRTLEQSTRPLPPIKAAIAELAACIESYANLFHERKEYDTLYYELEELFQVLQYHCTQYIPPAITATVEALCKSIQNEISDIHQKQDKAKLRQYLEAKQDSDAVLAGYRRIQGYLQRISLNADISMWRLMDEVATDNRLNRLSSSLSACYNSAQAVELKRGPCTKVYWMSGMAGTGKTTIAYNLCLELDANRRLGASFFCSRLFPECRNVHLIIPSIAYQLARSSRPFRFKLAGVLEKDPDVHTRLPYLQFDALLAQPLLEVKDTLSDNLVVVIDALDECDNKESTSQILDVLLANASDLPVKFVISSRPEPEIRDEMMKQGNQAESRVVLHELDRYVVQADIETYLRATLAQLDPTEEQIAALVERAGILFIYAATVVRYISHDRFRRNPRARLCNILESSSSSENKHKEIDELYATILRAGLDDHTLDSGERKDIRLVLHTAICAQEPLTTDALSGLLGINDIERVRTALRPLWSVLHVSGASELVTTLHASFPDYMLDPSRSGQYHCNPKMHNQTIARFCFDYFRNVRPQFNICVLESSYVRDDEVEGLEERVQSAITTGLFYAARYWAMHLRSATESPDLLKELEEFLSARLLLWMEVMNLKKCAGAMPQTIRLVETWGAVSAVSFTGRSRLIRGIRNGQPS
ncbi:hypothetical protein FRC11_008824 [Ceratobasidium sp. 423]|nr:hypothetical protein FRC11_008824 [Ceratobasidium sp. 423]